MGRMGRIGLLIRGGRVIVGENPLALPGHPAAGEVRLLNTVPSAMTAPSTEYE